MTPATKWCSRCQRELPITDFAVYAGQPASYCRPCRRAWSRERRAQPDTRERENALARERYRVRMATDAAYRRKRRRAAQATRKRQTEAKLRDRAERQRFYYFRDRDRQNATSRLWTQYVRPSKGETVDADPLREFIARAFPGWTIYEIAEAIDHRVSARLLSRVVVEHAKRVELDAADRFLTGMGRPDLLDTLYPYEPQERML